MLKLTERLACVASMVMPGAVAADIGTDHAYIPIYLVKNKICQKVIATDINKGPLDRAQSNINRNRLSQFISTRLGAGLKPLSPGEVNTIIIAGMGGLLIRDILYDSPQIVSAAETLILQPMIAQEVVREWLYNNNFTIVDEKLAKEENKIYTVITAEHGYEKVDEIYYDIGKKLIDNKDPLLSEYLQKKINELNKIVISLEGEYSENACLRRFECKEKLNKYNEILYSI